MTEQENWHLEYREGASDKEYNVWLVKRLEGVMVQTSWGRRGSSLSVAAKTKTPVTLEAAQAIVKKVLAEKKAKGYQEKGFDGQVMQPATSKEDTGLRPQLLNEIDDDRLAQLIADDAYVMQPKMDGRRTMAIFNDGTLTGVNRKGQAIPLPGPVVDGLMKMNPWGKSVIDGELVGDVFYAFDLLEWDEEDYRLASYDDRFLILKRVPRTGGAVQLVLCARTSHEKHELFIELRDRIHGEGVVFKRIDAPYVAGRPNSGGSQLKWKFTAEADVLVSEGREGKRSVGMMLMGPLGEWEEVGNVTIPANHEIPQLGQVIAVRYLYAFRGGSLFQPVYLGVRDDKSPAETTLLRKLKFKPEDSDDES